MMLAPKLEHQVALGAEAVTIEEALKQWTTLTFRPETSLCRVRISVDSSEVLQVEKRTPVSINNEIKRLYKIDVEESLILLHNIIQELKTANPGRYLLRHTVRNGASATIFRETKDSGKNVFDLHTVYGDESLYTVPNAPWPAIDRMVVTPANKCFEQMPAMFRPRKIFSTTPANIQTRSAAAAANKGKKKRTKKKKNNSSKE